ncbi:hypothetical protein H9Q74_003020 [Fusarium xylarioides]|nr:hypothetical protein H9Q71_001491 [Fusarium xylarioides]KAG5826894.1 hypothetical protein H9Q74_003020 [Fusarium xylarioides]
MFFSLFTVLALALPVPAISSSNSTCTPDKIQTRIEWANMESDVQQSYLKAVKCLMQLPAQTGIKATYLEFWEATGFTTHGAGHSGVGGVMEDIDASPGDPLFYIHHGFIDRLWWKWQSENLDGRLYQLGGPSAQGGT